MTDYTNVPGYKEVDLQWVEVIDSPIHGKGVRAKKDIPKGTHIIEYVGELVTKEESDARADRDIAANAMDENEGAVYIFTLNDKYDIDGNVEWNPTRFINHSCSPNAEAVNVDGEIWIVATKKIPAGTEIVYNYGYDLDNWEDHPCRCGSGNCIGYIAGEEHWKKLRRLKGKHKKRK